MAGPVLAEELTAMMAEQKALMQRTGGGSVGPVPVEIRREQREVFVRHADRLAELLQVHGWPTAAKVGPDAARGAWLVAQHADTQVDVQRLAVRLLRDAVRDDEATAYELAFLEDRLAVNEGRYQLYGTQIADIVDGKPVPWPCAEPEQLDQRRATVGLEPLDQYTARYS